MKDFLAPTPSVRQPLFETSDKELGTMVTKASGTRGQLISKIFELCDVLRFGGRSEKLQTESSPNFSNFRPEFCPEFCSEFSPNSRSFRASFRGKRRPEKIHQKSPPFFNAKFPGKHEKNIHKMFLESRQSKDSGKKKEPKLARRGRGTRTGPLAS